MNSNDRADEVLVQFDSAPERDHPSLDQVVATVSYLPAPRPLHHRYEHATAVGTVRTEAMDFFGVRDYKDRDTHEFFLEFEGRRLTNMAETLAQLLGPHKRDVHFNLIEEVIQGARRI